MSLVGWPNAVAGMPVRSYGPTGRAAMGDAWKGGGRAPEGASQRGAAATRLAPVPPPLGYPNARGTGALARGTPGRLK